MLKNFFQAYGIFTSNVYLYILTLFVLLNYSLQSYLKTCTDKATGTQNT